MTGHKRIATILMMAVICVTLCFASFYIAYEYEHECEGDTCPICFQIDVFEAVVKTCDAASQQSSAPAGNEFKFDDSIDYIDLTTMNGTMVYAQVLNIVQNPEQYIGKTLKMSGTFGAFYDEAVKFNYFACMIADATACCSQGIEFTLGDNAVYPDDYPEPGSEIVVEGEITTYEIEGYVIPTVKDARLL